MALKTFGGRTFAALTFAALTLHGPATQTVVEPVRHGGSSSAQYLASRTLEAIELRDQEEILVILNTLASLGII